VRRRLGNEVLDELVAPFVSGIYAGDAERLSVQACFGRLADFEKHSGSITRGVFSAIRRNRKERPAEVQESLRPYRLCSFQNGLSTLTDAIASMLGESIFFETRIDSVTLDRTNAAHEYVLRITHGQRSMLISTRSIVIATRRRRRLRS
jgi:oxygen-dependent protoporphyrinogen oxidase